MLDENSVPIISATQLATYEFDAEGNRTSDIVTEGSNEKVLGVLRDAVAGVSLVR